MFCVFSHATARGRQSVPARLASTPRIVQTTLGVVLCGVLSATAFAATTTVIRLEGDIAPECAIGGGTSSAGTATLGLPLDIGDISRPGRREYAFGLNCNAPFAYRLEAQHGALTKTAAGPAPAPKGFSTAVPYEVAMYIPTDGAPIDDRCSGASIAAGRVVCVFSNSGSNIALGVQGRLTVTWTPQSAMLLAGDYVDRLTVKVAPSL